MYSIKQRVLFILVLCVLQGCAVTNIPLKEMTYSSSEIPTVQWKTIVLVSFSDARGVQGIGYTNDGAEIVAKGDISMWATKNLASVLQKAGYRVSIASSLEQAQRENASYIITGAIDMLHLEVASFSSTASVKVTIQVMAPGGKTISETFSASRSAVTNPFGDTEAEVVLESLLQAYSGITSLLR